MNAPINPDVHLLTGAYAINALDELERRQFERHLVECPDCAREVAELRATAARLGGALAEPPPEDLRRRVLAEIATTRQAAPSDPTPSAEHKPRRWALRLTAAAAVVGLVAAAAFGVLAVRTRHQLDVAQSQAAQAQARIAQAQARYGPVGEVLAAPDLRATTASSPTGGVAITMASARLDKAVLMVSGMPDPPAGHAYQAWVISAAGPRSAGLLRPGPDSVAPPLVFGGLAHGELVGVTVEPAAGSAKPTTNPVMLFDLPV